LGLFFQLEVHLVLQVRPVHRVFLESLVVPEELVHQVSLVELAVPEELGL
jgi:hypothetical protein